MVKHFLILSLAFFCFSCGDNKETPMASTSATEVASTPAAVTGRVVFMGNSITEGWAADSTFWAGKDYLNKGISGQTTPQMLERFQADVVDNNPESVVILAGINDIAQNSGPITLEAVFENIKAMATMADAAGIKVVLCSVLPAKELPWRPEIKPAEKVVKLNEMIQSFAKQENMRYVDYYSAMVDDEMGLREVLTNDGVHVTLAGYEIMGGLVERAL